MDFSDMPVLEPQITILPKKVLKHKYMSIKTNKSQIGPKPGGVLRRRKRASKGVVSKRLRNDLPNRLHQAGGAARLPAGFEQSDDEALPTNRTALKLNALGFEASDDEEENFEVLTESVSTSSKFKCM
jgi:hypothetical protein